MKLEAVTLMRLLAKNAEFVLRASDAKDVFWTVGIRRVRSDCTGYYTLQVNPSGAVQHILVESEERLDDWQMCFQVKWIAYPVANADLLAPAAEITEVDTAIVGRFSELMTIIQYVLGEEGWFQPRLN